MTHLGMKSLVTHRNKHDTLGHEVTGDTERNMTHLGMKLLVTHRNKHDTLEHEVTGDIQKQT